MGDKRTAQANSGRCDPPVTVVQLVTERVPDPLAARPQLRAGSDHRVVGLGNRQFGDPALEPTGPQFTPSGTQSAKTQFHHRLEGQQHPGRPDRVTVAVREQVGPLVKQLADHHGVHDHEVRRGGAGHA